MQVMQSHDLSTSEVLIGQTSATQNFGVSDDPMLMSMLSTGFYANPLRTMIQEVMFNAWDAHRMGNCLDKPIDVYINETSGLIIRDYGPGIPDEDIHSIYCMYGGSTKRKDKRLTGGFGLGSKSPFAYSESFTVTSMNQHTKCVYLISRVSEDGGKPGLTRLVKVSTVETGLTVTVPLEAKDHHTAYQYITDVLFLSGIKANVHYKDSELELYESKSLIPGEYHVPDYDKKVDSNGLYAVYGGVRYEIPKHNDYATDYEFLRSINPSVPFYIGFAPDTLTPLPNREGLNMSSKSREAIKVGLELCIERFKVVISPLIHAFFRANFEEMVKQKAEPHFALRAAFKVAHNSNNLISREDFVKKMLPHPPLNSDPFMWQIVLHTLRFTREVLFEAIGRDEWIKILTFQFINAYPDSKAMGIKACREIRNCYKNGTSISYTFIEDLLASTVNPKTFKKLYDFTREMRAEFPEDDSLHPMFRYKTDISTFSKMSFTENKPNTYDKKPSVKQMPEDPTSFYNEKTGQLVEQPFISNIVVLAKTAQSLRDVHYALHLPFLSKNPSLFYTTSDSLAPYISCVVHNRKGAYQKAKQLLEAKGFTVFEAPEPMKRVPLQGIPKPSVPEYPLVDMTHSEWNSDITIPDPTHYLYILKSNLNEYRKNPYYSRYTIPGEFITNLMVKLHPKMVMVYTETQAEAFKKKGVIPFEDAVQKYFLKLFEGNAYLIRNLVRAYKITRELDLHLDLLKNPVIHTAIGMAKVKPENEIEFWSKLTQLGSILTNSYNPFVDLRNKGQTTVEDLWNNDPMKSKIKTNCNIMSVFSGSGLRSKYNSMTDQDKNQFANSIAAFIRSNQKP